MMTEVVETCPHCGSENVLGDWDVETHGFVAKCWQCGNEILLCDECLHADDNPGRRCDWHGIYANGKERGGSCFRGTTRMKSIDRKENR